MELNEIKMIVFDMAGTVVDEKNVVYKTLQKALNLAGYDFTLETVLTNAGGKEKFQAIKDMIALSNTDEGKSAEEAYDSFLTFLKEAYENLDVSTYSGVEELMERLREKDIKIVLNTGYNTITAENLLKKMSWKKGKQYDLLVAADKVKNGRPAPDMILLAMEEFKITDAKYVAKVGDSVIDIEEGKAANCGLTFGVTTGAHTQNQLEEANPDFILDTLCSMDKYIA
ncbi:HAD hydrolase-like protein [Chondrinema litorale]|uniref:HAD hydrolase-like protein n=1 Tax=Chondrinema litorale TaxID=2994555 RepID=UPI002543A284|nr:HAD hydrolase-like protein [Chondrinema litorale]UZR97493.1 HAD hydrolase-like protein [Chondrinema litorale]